MKQKIEVDQSADHNKQYHELVTNYAMHKAIMTNSIHAMFIGHEDGSIIETNPAACEMFGYTETELKKLKRTHLIVHNDQFKKIVEERAKNGTAKGECIGIRKNGEHILCEISSTFTNIDGVQISTTMMVDVTEKRRLEKLLANTNQMALVGGWENDLIRNKIYWSSVCRLIHEIDESLDITNDLMNSFYKNRNDGKILEGAIQRSEAFDLEFEIITAKGNERWLRINGKPEFDDNKLIRYYGSMQDITSNKLTLLNLERSKQEYQSLFDNSVDSIISVNLDGIIQIANQGASELFECPIDQLVGKPLGNFTPSESMPFFNKNLNEIIKGKSSRGSVREIITAKGNKKTILGNMAPIWINNQMVGISAIANDITVRQRYQKETEFHSRLLNTIQQGVIVFSLDYKISFWNEYASELYGWAADEVIGRNIIDVTRPEITEEERKELLQKFLEEGKWSGELTMRTKQGKKITVHITHSPIMDEVGIITDIISTSFDITKEVEARDYIQFQAKLLDSVDQAVYSSDLKGTIVYWNRHAEKLYGWEKDEILGKQGDLLDDADPTTSKSREEIRHALREGKSWSGELRMQNKTGTILPVFSMVSPIVDDTRKTIGLISVTYDISKRKEEEQQRELERLDKEGLINTINESFWSMDRNYRMLAGNRPFLELLKKLTNKTFKKGDLLLFPGMMEDHYLQTLLSLYDRGLAGEAFTIDFISPLTGRWLEHSINPIFDQGAVIGIACLSKDITDRKETEKRKDLELLDKEALINTSQDFIWSMDKNYTLLAANQSLIAEIKRLINVEIKRGIVFRLDLLFPTAYGHFLHDCVNRGLSGESFSNEFRSPLTNKWFEISVRPILNNNDVVGVACYNKNITQRKAAEETIRVSNERYNFVSKATNDCIWDWRLDSNETIWSGNMETLFGYTLPDTQTNNATFWIDRLHPEDSKHVLYVLQDIFDQPDQNIWHYEYRFLKADGTYAYVHDKAYIIRDDENKPLRMIGAMQDITHRKETELLLKDLNEKIKQRALDLQDSNSELERFAYVASHDLQEPLRMVSSFLLLLEKRLKENNLGDIKAEQYMSYALDGASRMKRLIFDLLEYSRAGNQKDAMSNTDMNEVMNEVMDIFRTQVKEKNATITTNVLPVLPNTRRTQMVQLMQNLIGNALKYNNSERPQINIDAKEDKLHWLLSVEDNGIGFESKFAEDIFVIFQRLHIRSEYSGTGIGLSICKKIVERHGGKIWAESTPGVGSKFYIRFPKLSVNPLMVE